MEHSLSQAIHNMFRNRLETTHTISSHPASFVLCQSLCTTQQWVIFSDMFALQALPLLNPYAPIRAQTSSEFPNTHRHYTNHFLHSPNNFTSGALTTAYPRPLPDTTILLNSVGQYCASIPTGCGGILFSKYHHEINHFLCPECSCQEIQEGAMANPHRSFGKQKRQRNLQKDAFSQLLFSPTRTSAKTSLKLSPSGTGCPFREQDDLQNFRNLPCPWKV